MTNQSRSSMGLLPDLVDHEMRGSDADRGADQPCIKYFWSQRSALVTSAAVADLTELIEVTIGSVICRYSIKLQK
jgi:hypothetical protein